MSQTPNTFEDTRELNQSLNQWNNLQDRLSEGGFTTAALKPKQAEGLQEMLEAAEQRFQEPYWNVRDELGYLEVMRRQLAEVLQKQAGSLPSVTLSSNLVAQAESYAQQFKAQKGDLDGLEELKILYSELQTYLWVTRLFIEQDSPNQEVVEALRKLKGQIVEHSEYLAFAPDKLDRGTPELDQLYNAYLNTSIQELTALSTELGGDFQIQAGPSNTDIKKKVDQLLAAFKNANLGKTTAARKAKLAEVQKSSLSLLKGFSKVKAFGPGGRGKAILSALRTIGEIALKARDIQLSLEEINEECLGKELEETLKKIQAKNLKAVQNYKKLLDKIGSDPCLENADPALLEEIAQRVLGDGDAAATQGSLSPIQTKYDRLLEAIQQVKVSASESELRGILAEANELLGLLDRFVGNTRSYLEELDWQCQNPCPDQEEILNLTSSKELENNLRRISGIQGILNTENIRVFAGGYLISDWRRLILFYADNDEDEVDSLTFT
ncbi:MAG: hypothetical protein AB7I41_09620 [Candidatus Sericytochromatia bacterium]